MLIDSHAHLGDNSIYPEIGAILKKAQEAGIESIVNICTDNVTLERGLKLQKKHPWIYNAASTTPHDAERDGDRLFPFMAEHARQGNIIAVGETGLDYYWHKETKSVQQELFIRYLHLALECNLPVIIHCRDAFEDFFSIIDSEYQRAPGVLHCFTGTLKEAEEVIKRNWYLSLSGIVTFKRSEELRKVARMVPLDQLLIETDTPYLAPQRRRGKRNEPAYLVETAKLIALEKGISFEELAKATRENAHSLFKM